MKVAFALLLAIASADADMTGQPFMKMPSFEIVETVISSKHVTIRAPEENIQSPTDRNTIEYYHNGRAYSTLPPSNPIHGHGPSRPRAYSTRPPAQLSNPIHGPQTFNPDHGLPPFVPPPPFNPEYIADQARLPAEFRDQEAVNKMAVHEKAQKEKETRLSSGTGGTFVRH